MIRKWFAGYCCESDLLLCKWGALTTNNVNSPFKVEHESAVEETTVLTLDTAVEETTVLTLDTAVKETTVLTLDTAVEETTVVTLDKTEEKHETTKKGKSAGNIFLKDLFYYIKMFKTRFLGGGLASRRNEGLLFLNYRNRKIMVL